MLLRHSGRRPLPLHGTPPLLLLPSMGPQAAVLFLTISDDREKDVATRRMLAALTLALLPIGLPLWSYAFLRTRLHAAPVVGYEPRPDAVSLGAWLRSQFACCGWDSVQSRGTGSEDTPPRRAPDVEWTGRWVGNPRFVGMWGSLFGEVCDHPPWDPTPPPSMGPHPSSLFGEVCDHPPWDPTPPPLTLHGTPPLLSLWRGMRPPSERSRTSTNRCRDLRDGEAPWCFGTCC
jgi:hypothetical protein